MSDGCLHWGLELVSTTGQLPRLRELLLLSGEGVVFRRLVSSVGAGNILVRCCCAASSADLFVGQSSSPAPVVLLHGVRQRTASTRSDESCTMSAEACAKADRALDRALIACICNGDGGLRGLYARLEECAFWLEQDSGLVGSTGVWKCVPDRAGAELKQLDAVEEATLQMLRR